MATFPSSITDVVRRYVADSITAADGTAVASWPDSSTNNSPATQATTASQPVVKTAILNGHKVVRFDGANDWLNTSTPYGWTTAGTRYAVVKVTLGGGEQTIVGGYGTDGSGQRSPSLRIGAYGAAGQLQVTDPSNGILADSGAFSLTGGAAVVFCWVWNANQTFAVFVNGTAVPMFVPGTATPVGAQTGTGAVAGIGLGGWYDPAAARETMAGDAAEYVFCSTAHGAAQRQAVHTYVQNQYGITVADFGSALSGTVTATPGTTIYAGQTVTLTASPSGGSGSYAVNYAKVAGPNGSLSSNTGTTTTGGTVSTILTPTTAGTYTVRATFLDGAQSVTVDTVVTVLAASSTGGPAAVDSTGWTRTPASGATDVQIMGDNDGGSYLTSGPSPTDQPLPITLGALTPPPAGVPLTVTWAVDSVEATTASVFCELIEGTTVRSTSAPRPVTGGVDGQPVTGLVQFTFPAADLTAIAPASWSALKVRLKGAAA